MKTRIVVMSLIFVVAPLIAGCSSVDEEENQNLQANRAVAKTDEKKSSTEIAQELKQAAGLLQQAQTELEQNTDESKLKALRTLGYPVFVPADFRDSRSFIAKLKKNPRGELSDYLFKEFDPTTRSQLENSEESPNGELLTALTSELNEQLQNEKLYDPSRFPKAPSPILADLERFRGAGNLHPVDLADMNRLLLQDSYRGVFASAPAESVLSHLEKAAESVKAIDPESRTKIEPRIKELFDQTRELFRTRSEDGADFSVTSSEISQLNSAVGNVITDIDPSHKPADANDGWQLPGLDDILKYALLFVVVVAFIGAVLFALKYLRGRSVKREQLIREAFSKVFERHDKLQQDFTSFKNQNASEINDLKDQLDRLETAQRNLSRQLAHAANQPNNNPPNNRYYEPAPAPAPVKEEPEFPVAAETYLRRLNGLNRQSTVIRPDFQNGILVKDTDGGGELLLIEEPHTPVDLQRLFVVPSVSEFQMKQDFYNYYDTYYECDQPTAGAVWILHPATVEKVTGGWRLTAKGRLEVR